jgi:hypothetical protein
MQLATVAIMLVITGGRWDVLLLEARPLGCAFFVGLWLVSEERESASANTEILRCAQDEGELCVQDEGGVWV